MNIEFVLWPWTMQPVLLLTCNFHYREQKEASLCKALLLPRSWYHCNHELLLEFSLSHLQTFQRDCWPFIERQVKVLCFPWQPWPQMDFKHLPYLFTINVSILKKQKFSVTIETTPLCTIPPSISPPTSFIRSHTNVALGAFLLGSMYPQPSIILIPDVDENVQLNIKCSIDSSSRLQKGHP